MAVPLADGVLWTWGGIVSGRLGYAPEADADAGAQLFGLRRVANADPFATSSADATPGPTAGVKVAAETEAIGPIGAVPPQKREIDL